MASSPPHSTSVASISESSATHPTASKPRVDGATNNGVIDEIEKKPQLVAKKPEVYEEPNESVNCRKINLKKRQFQASSDLYSPEYMEKYRKYEAEHTQMLMSTYFSDKNFYGGDIFNEKTAIGGEVIQSSRWPCTRAFADPVQAFEDQSSSSSTSVDEVPHDLSNGNPTSKE